MSYCKYRLWPYNKIMKKQIVCMLLAFTSSAIANNSYISSTQTLSDSGYEYRFENSFFKTSSFVDYDSTEIPLQDGESYFSLDSILGIKYAPTSNLELLSDLRFRVNQSSENVGADNKTFTQGGPESIFIGINYGSNRDEGLQYILKTYFRKGLYSNESYDPSSERESIVLGDGGDGYYIGVGVSFLSKDNNFYEFEIGYRNPSSDLSNEILTNTKIAIAWKPVSLIFGVEYLASLGQDPFADDPNGKDQISSGSTFLYNSINRSYTDPYVGLNFRLGTTWRMETKVAQRLFGTSTDLGLRAGVSFIKRISNSNNFKNKNSSFKQYEIEGVVTKITKSRSAVVIDQGISTGLKKGDRVDFYHFDFLDGDALIATGIVAKSGYDKAIVKIMKKYSKRKVKEGTVIRSGLIR